METAPPMSMPRGTGDWRKTHQWAHGLCGCFDNMGICVLAFCIPCVTFGQTSEALGKNCCVYGWLFAIPILNWFLEVQQRLEIRNIRGIPGSFIGDLCLVAWCTPCTLTQEAQEVELLQAQERAAAAGVTLPVGGIGPGHVGVVVTNEPTSSAVSGGTPSGNMEYQPGYQPATHPNPMVAGLDYSPPSLATEEAEMDRH